MRIIIDCDASDFDAAVRLLREEFRDWERHYDKVGYGWVYPLAGGRCFIRRITGGLSLKQIRAPLSSGAPSPQSEPKASAGNSGLDEPPPPALPYSAASRP